MTKYLPKLDIKLAYEFSEKTHFPLSHLHRGEDHDTKTFQAIFKEFTTIKHYPRDDTLANAMKLVDHLNKDPYRKEIFLSVKEAFSPFSCEGVKFYDNEISFPWALARLLIIAQLPYYYQNLLGVLTERSPDGELPKVIDSLIQEEAYHLSDALNGTYNCLTLPHEIFTEKYANWVLRYMKSKSYFTNRLKTLIEYEYSFNDDKGLRPIKVMIHLTDFFKWKKLCRQVIKESKV